MKTRPKVGVVGAGNVGATCAFELAEREVADVVLIDVVEGIPQGKGLDMLQAGPVVGFDSLVVGSQDYKSLEGADVVVITAGLARKPGMSRLDLLSKNAEIVGGCARKLREYAPDCVIIVVTNPLDVMAYVAMKESGFPANRVLGMAGVLDSARFAAFIALELGCSVKDVQAMVLGGHGDQMVPLPRFTTVSGIPITELMPRERIDALSARTAKGGAEIVELLKTGSAYYAPGISSAAMVEAILRDQRRIMPCAAYLTGQYGLNGLFICVPCLIGSGGLRKVYELSLTDTELKGLHHSADILRKSMQEAKLL
jgi:malate dehydrogenase